MTDATKRTCRYAKMSNERRYVALDYGSNDNVVVSQSPLLAMPLHAATLLVTLVLML